MVEKRGQNSPESDDLDRLLRELALEAQKHSPQSPQRQVALNRLWQLIWKSNRLGHPQQGRWTSSIYEDLYNEAIARTCLEICQKIDRYDSKYPVMLWVNSCLKFNFKQVVKECYEHTFLPSLDDLDLDIPVDEIPSEAQVFRKFLEEDPEGLLKSEQLREQPNVTFQFLAIARHVEDRNWKDISDELEISIQTLCSFFNRCLGKLTLYFYKYNSEVQPLLQFLREDPAGSLKAEYLKKQPNVTFQFLAIEYIEDRTWKDISDELGIPIQNLFGFVERCSQKLKPDFNKYLQQ
jgi:DNA-directed RNA polymerase specialized sigma24 family protein